MTKPKTIKRYKRTGQSGSEYALAIGLIAVVAITGLGAIGLNLTNTFSGMITNQQPAPQAPLAQAPPVPPVPQVLAAPAEIPQNPLLIANFPPAPKGTESVCFEGKCVHLPVIDEVNDLVETSGPNGVERIYQFSNVLSQMAEQLSQEPGVDPALVSLISDLANNGHGLGDQQESVRKQRQGQYVPLAPATKYHDQSNLFSASYQSLSQYLQNHPDQLSPVSKQVITTQVEQIQKLASAFSAGGTGEQAACTPRAGCPVVAGKAKLTHQSANIVCQQGGENCTRPI